jgi:hypothetical protein
MRRKFNASDAARTAARLAQLCLAREQNMPRELDREQ